MQPGLSIQAQGSGNAAAAALQSQSVGGATNITLNFNQINLTTGSTGRAVGQHHPTISQAAIPGQNSFGSAVNNNNTSAGNGQK